MAAPNDRRSLVFALAYDVASLPLAAGVLYPLIGWLLSPQIAATAMAFSSVGAISNALTLRAARIWAASAAIAWPPEFLNRLEEPLDSKS